MDAPEDAALVTCSVRFRLTDSEDHHAGAVLAEGTGEARLFADELQIWPEFAEPVMFLYRDMAHVLDANYIIKVRLTSGESLELSQMGYRYEDLVRELRKLRSELMLKDMLMSESLLKDETSRQLPGFRGSFGIRSAAEREECEIRMYQPGLVIIPKSSDPIRIPYSEISSIQAENFTLSVLTEGGRSYAFMQLGRDFEPLTRNLSRALKELAARSQALCKELFPLAQSKDVWAVARLMKEGRAARRRDIDAVSTALWPQFEKRMESLGLLDSYLYLSALARRDRVSFGFKRGLASQFEGDYIWFLAPIGEGRGKPGNAIAMESATAEGGAKATYFFRFMSRASYRTATEEQCLEAMDQAIAQVNHSMIDVNFRREPIYLPDERLLEPRYVRYFHAVRLLPSLRVLRESFIGRVMHVSEDQWKRDVKALLSFNVETSDDSVKWKRAASASGEDDADALERAEDDSE